MIDCIMNSRVLSRKILNKVYFHVAEYFTFTEPADRCDWPNGVCAYIGDRCPPDIPYDCHTKYYCPLATNKCCCREEPS